MGGLFCGEFRGELVVCILGVLMRRDSFQGEFSTNVAEGGRNAVTWGVFPGQEVAQSTIIEKESFLAWKVRSFQTCATLTF